MGGLIIISSIVISTFLWSDLGNHYILLLLFGILSFGLIGFYDDYKKLVEGKSDGIKGRLKLFFQIISASLITIYLYIFMDTGDTSSVMPFLKDNSIYLGILFIPWSIFILVVVSVQKVACLYDKICQSFFTPAWARKRLERRS